MSARRSYLVQQYFVQSRQHLNHQLLTAATVASQPQQSSDESTAVVPRTPDDFMRALHNSKVGHTGACVLRHRLNKFYSRHGIAFQDIRCAEFCLAAGHVRLPDGHWSMRLNRLQPTCDNPVSIGGRVRLPDNHVDGQGDRFERTAGNHELVCQTRLPGPSQDILGGTQFFTTFQRFELLHSDPGSHFMNEVFKLLLDYANRTTSIVLCGARSCDTRQRWFTIHDRRDGEYMIDGMTDPLVLGCSRSAQQRRSIVDVRDGGHTILRPPTGPIAGDK